MKIGFCPQCGTDLDVFDIEFLTQNIIWKPCGCDRCRYNSVYIKSSSDGYVLEPMYLAGRYIFTRPAREERNGNRR